MSYFIFPMYMMLNRWMENIARLYVVYRFQLSNYFISQNKLYITYIIREWSMIVWAANTSFDAWLNLHRERCIKKNREREKNTFTFYHISILFFCKSFISKANAENGGKCEIWSKIDFQKCLWKDVPWEGKLLIQNCRG